MKQELSFYRGENTFSNVSSLLCGRAECWLEDWPVPKPARALLCQTRLC